MERTKSKEISKSTVFHAVSVGILIVSLLFSIVRFPAVLFRTVQSFVDLATSIAYYFTELMGFYGAVTPTVNVIPDNAVEVLPFDPLEFQAKLQLVGEEFVKGENVGIFFAEIGSFMIKLCRWIPTILLACLLFYIIGQLFYSYLTVDEVEKYLLSKVFEDTGDIKARKMLVNTFIQKILWYGDKITIIYNFQENGTPVRVTQKNIEDLERQVEQSAQSAFSFILCSCIFQYSAPKIRDNRLIISYFYISQAKGVGY